MKLLESTRDGFAGQFTQNSNAVREAGCTVETHILQNYPHGYGTGGNASVWGNYFDAFLTLIMQGNASGIKAVKRDKVTRKEIYYVDGKRFSSADSARGLYVMRTERGNMKVLK